MKCEKCQTEFTPKRTSSQNRALHLWYGMVASELNNAGYTVQMILEKKVDLDFTADIVKDMLWKPAQRALLKKTSTTKLAKQEEIDLVYDHLCRHLGEKFGIEVPPFPSAELLEQLDSTFTSNKGIR